MVKVDMPREHLLSGSR